MNEEKLFGMQMQVRQNQQELMDYVKELDGWGEEMKLKEQQLKQEKQSCSELPPVRNSLQKKKKKKVTKTSNATEKLPGEKRIHGYDYRAWDQFDVDKACAAIDEEKASSPSEYETDEEWEEVRVKKQADQLKEQGNQCFNESRYDEAVECYTQAIGLDGNYAVLYANRAMALLKQEIYAAAELDCTEAITRDPVYVKAFCRRATARVALKNYSGARDDYQRVLELEPTNRLAQTELKAVEQILNPSSELKAEQMSCDTGVVKPIYKPPSARSKKPLRRVPIEEIGADDPKVSQMFQKRLEVDPCDVVRRDLDAFDAKFGSGDDNSCSHTAVTDSKQAGTLLSSTSVEKSNAGRRHGSGEAISTSQTGDSLTSGSAHMLSDASTVPTGSFQFQADWKTLKNRPEEFYTYFKQIEPSCYCRVFGEALDADMLGRILETLKNFYIRDQLDVFPVLANLTAVRRFATMIMFLSPKDKQVVKDLFEHLSTSTYLSDIVDPVKRQFDV